MAELNIPNLNKKSDKYLFKKKLTLKRKSKKRLLSESFFMFSLGILLVFLVYLIPDKISLFENFNDTLIRSIAVLFDFLFYIYQIVLVIFMVISILISFLLFFGSFYRLFKVLKRKTKKISYN